MFIIDLSLFGFDKNHHKIISLDKNWEFTCILYDQYYPASIPGSVHMDLFRNKLIPDPFKAQNEKQLQWIDTLEWIYKTTFTKPNNLNVNDKLEIVFKGLDTYANIYLNDSLLFSANNMFVPWKIKIDPTELKKQNILILKFKSPLKEELKKYNNYLNIFQDILPQIVNTYSPNIPYTSSSPVFGRGNSKSCSEGDNHYWYVWHDAYDFDWYNKVTGRFMSEFGFQSFPSMETIEYFDTSLNKRTDSEIMIAHQKHNKGNFLINHYMKDYYPVPENLDDFIYISQLLQAEGIRTGIMAQRRAKPFCMGSLYWQLNDCWPAISWSSIDYSGNRKALHYFDLLPGQENKVLFKTNENILDIENQCKYNSLNNILKPDKSLSR